MIPYTTIPFMSAIFLVFVGVLIGHLFWYRFREEQETRTDHWKEKATRLKTAFESQTEAHEELESRWTELKQRSEQWQSDLSVARAVITTLEKERDEYQSQWDLERETRARLTSSLEEEQREAEQWKERCQAAESLATKLQSQVAEQSRLAEKTNAELQQLQKARHEAAALAQATEQELTDLRSRAKDWDSQHTAVVEQLRTAQAAEKELRQSLAEQSKQFTIQADQLGVLHDQLRKQLKSAEAQIEVEQSRYADLLTQYEQMLAGEDQSKRQSSQREAELQRLTEQLSQESLKNQQLATQLTSEASARKQLQETMQHQARREQVLLDEIVPLRVAAEEAKKLKKEIAAVKSQLDSSQVAHHDLQTRMDDATAVRTHLEDELKLVRVEVQTYQKKLQTAAAELDAVSRELADARKELELKQSDLATREDALSEQSRDRESLTMEVQSLQSQLEAERQRWQAVEAQYRQAELQLAGSQEQHASWTKQEAELREQCERERAAREVAENEQELLRQELEQLGALDEKLGQRDLQLRQLQDEVRELKRSRDEALSAASSTREIVAELRDELSDRLESFEVTENEKATAVRELQLERQRREQLAEACQRWEHEWKLMQQQLSDSVEQRTVLEQLRQESADRVVTLTQQLEELQLRSRESQRRAEQADARSQELLARLDQQEELTRRLRSKRFAERETMAGDHRNGALSFRGIRSKELTQREIDEAGMQRDPRFGRIYNQAPHRIDDLTRIPGIDGALRDSLHRLGVYTFRQIMEWDTKIVQEVGRQLGLRDAIDRDDWVGNARRLHHQWERAVA